MKILTFQAERFAWRPHVAPDGRLVVDAQETALAEVLVVFLHVEAAEVEAEQFERTVRHATKHVQWLANKRALRRVVLHSFTHLSASTAPVETALAWIERLRARLAEKGYELHTTPFGFTCAWDLRVYGDSLAKVWKEL